MQSCISIFVLSFFCLLSGCERQTPDTRTEIAVLVPLQHPAMDAIVAGLRAELAAGEYAERAHVTVYNAQADAALQSAILQQLKLKGTPIIMPIGTAATQMAVQQLPGRQIVHLAAKFEQEDRQPGQSVCGVLDELAPEASVDLAMALLPGLRKMTVIHSSADKVYPEIAALQARAASCGIEVQRLLVQAQSDLYTMGLQIAEDSEALLVLKDHLVVAGVATLSQFAQTHQIPLIAADEGSVKGGADLAAGVPEASIGRAGASLVKLILAGANAAELPIVRVDDIHLFYRPGCQERLPVCTAAEQLGYTAEELSL